MATRHASSDRLHPSQPDPRSSQSDRARRQGHGRSRRGERQSGRSGHRMDARIRSKTRSRDHEASRWHVPQQETGDRGDRGQGTPGRHLIRIRRNCAPFGRQDRCCVGMLVGKPGEQDTDEQGLDHGEYAIKREDPCLSLDGSHGAMSRKFIKGDWIVDRVVPAQIAIGGFKLASTYFGTP